MANIENGTFFDDPDGYECAKQNQLESPVAESVDRDAVIEEVVTAIDIWFDEREDDYFAEMPALHIHTDYVAAIRALKSQPAAPQIRLVTAQQLQAGYVVFPSGEHKQFEVLEKRPGGTYVVKEPAAAPAYDSVTQEPVYQRLKVTLTSGEVRYATREMIIGKHHWLPEQFPIKVEIEQLAAAPQTEQVERKFHKHERSCYEFPDAGGSFLVCPYETDNRNRERRQHVCSSWGTRNQPNRRSGADRRKEGR